MIRDTEHQPLNPKRSVTRRPTLAVSAPRHTDHMSLATKPTTARPARTAIRLRADLRLHRCEAARWALEAGRPLNLDALTVILSARALEASVDGHPITHWTTQNIITFTWGAATQLCNSRGIALPATTAESLYTYLAFLSDTGRLAPNSSPPEMLLETVVDVSGLRADGRQRVTASRN